MQTARLFGGLSVVVSLDSKEQLNTGVEKGKREAGSWEEATWNRERKHERRVEEGDEMSSKINPKDL